MNRLQAANIVFGITIWVLLPIAALAKGGDIHAGKARETSVPVNVGLVPYVDVNSHFAGPRNNFSLDALVGRAFKVDGAAIAGLSGFVDDSVRGVQLGGLSGYTGGDLTGVQLSGLVSATRGRVAGLQLSGIVNTAGSIRGAQIGLVNIGGKVQGLQLGLVNVADEVDGIAVGLLNFVGKNGRHSLDLWTSDTAAFSLGTKLGTRYFYSIVGLGLQRAKGATAWMPTLGLGGSIPIAERGFVNVEALASVVNIGSEWDQGSILAQLRLVGGYRLNDRFGLFAGPVLNFFRSSSGKRLSDISYVSTLASANESSTPVDFGVGFVAGVQAF